MLDLLYNDFWERYLFSVCVSDVALRVAKMEYYELMNI